LPRKIKKERFYYNQEFLGSPDGRSIRILSEYYGPLQRLMRNNIRDTIVFFGSARIQSRNICLEQLRKAKKSKSAIKINRATANLKTSKYYEDARELASRFTLWSKKLKTKNHRYIICSGGGPGIMEAANQGAKEAGGISIGLTISLPNEQSGNKWISKDLDLKFHYFFMRKLWFLYLSKALIVWPGGFGTLDELMELLTLIQTKKIRKKVPIVLYGRDFWEKVINWDYLVEIGTISKNDLNLFHISDNKKDTFKYVTSFIKKYQLKGPNF
tara:strand:+ start:979 stop:1791 length:813 start_codon:yes stop_codon:yes gene_type:complete